MAGAAGHILSPWEDLSLTFGEVKELIDKALSGKLDKATEKLDGVNLLLTYREGDVYLARSLKQTRDNGKESIRWDKIEEVMKTPESKVAYREVATDFHNLFNDFGPGYLEWFFMNGKWWLNMEILTPDMENIIPYGGKKVRIHNIMLSGESGSTTMTLMSIIDKIQEYKYSVNTVYDIDKTNKVIFSEISQEIKDFINKKLQDLMDDNGLEDSNTLNHYLDLKVLEFIEDYFDAYYDDLDPEGIEFVDNLIQRWAYNNKYIRIDQLLKGKDPDLVSWVKENDKNDFQTGVFMDPIIEIFNQAGVVVLQNLKGTVAGGLNLKILIQDKIVEAIEKYKGIDKNDFIETQLRRFSQAGEFNGITPIEGIVFEFHGKAFKLTGTYLPILKLISFFRFGRDK
jgi:hypothetical protein